MNCKIWKSSTNSLNVWQWPNWTTVKRFHMTSRQPLCHPKTMKQRPCCPKQTLWELYFLLFQQNSMAAGHASETLYSTKHTNLIWSCLLSFSLSSASLFIGFLFSLPLKNCWYKQNAKLEVNRAVIDIRELKQTTTTTATRTSPNGLMSKTIAVHVRYRSSSAKQQREMTKFCVDYGTWTTTANLSNLHLEFNAAIAYLAKARL